eukprot:9844739-Alexandrium_andersonii.AAC.1
MSTTMTEKKSGESKKSSSSLPTAVTMVVEIGKISPITEVGADEEVVLARATRLKRDTVVEVVGMPGALSATTAMERMTSTTMTEKRSE